MPAFCYLVGVAVVASWVDGEFWSDIGSGGVNTDADCGLRGSTLGNSPSGADLDNDFGVAFILATLALVLSVAQSCIYVAANHMGRAKTTPA